MLSTGEVMFDTMTQLDETKLKKMAEAGVKEFVVANDLLKVMTVLLSMHLWQMLIHLNC